MNTIGAHTQNALLSSAVTVAISSSATSVLICCLTQNIRVTLDGTVPTATKGLLIVAGGNPIELPVPSGGSMKIIEVTTTAVVDYQFLGA